MSAGALISLELRSAVGGRKTWVLGAILVLTTLLAYAVGSRAPEPPPEVGGWSFVVTIMLTLMFLQTLGILVPLLFASSIFRTELEEGTLVYLVTRPVSKARLLLCKVAGVLAISLGVVVLGMLAFQVGFAVGCGDTSWWQRGLRLTAAGALGVIGYTGVFTLVGLLSRRALIFGIVYGFLSELVLSNVPAVISKLTLMHYIRSFGLQGLTLPEDDANQVLGLLDLSSSPVSVLVILAVSGVCLALAAAIVSGRELVPDSPEE